MTSAETITKAELISRLGRLRNQEDNARTHLAQVTYEVEQLVHQQEQIWDRLRELKERNPS